MEVLEPWNHATSNHPDAMALIVRVQDVLASFVKALKRSKEVAQHGFKVSEDMIHLCDHLADDHIRSANIEGFIADMMPQTKNVAKDSKKVVNGFRDVRKELNLITNDIPGQVSNIHEEHKDEIKKLEVAVKHGERVKIAKAVGTTAVGLAGGVIAIVFPPALIFLPVALPIIHIVSELISNRTSKAISEREIQTRNCEEALETLQKMTEDIVQLNMCINEFAAFWTNVEMLLGVLTGRIRELRNTKALDLRLKTVKSSWVDIKDSYETYAAKVELLCQLVTPPARPALPPTSGEDATGKGTVKNRTASVTINTSQKGQVLKKQKQNR